MIKSKINRPEFLEAQRSIIRERANRNPNSLTSITSRGTISRPKAKSTVSTSDSDGITPRWG